MMNGEIKVTSSRDFDYFNRMMNHPDIYPFVRDDSIDGQIDVSVLNKKANVFLKVEVDGHEAGFAFFVAKGVFCYEMHSGMLSDFRGAIAIKSGISVLDWMFVNTDAETISTFAWSSAKNVIFAARQVGFKEVSRSPWKSTVNGERIDRIVYSLSISEWSRNAQERFESISFGLVGGFNSNIETHSFSAMASLMALSGHYSKAQDFYNRWAVIFDGTPIQFTGTRERGVIFSIGKSFVEISPDLKTSIVEQVA